MTATESYTIDRFIEDARAIWKSTDGDRDQIIAQLKPLVEQVLWDDGLFDESKREMRPNGRARYLFHQEPDGSLQIYVVEFEDGMPTPVHDHATWGLIGIAGGKQRTHRYDRLDDRSDPTRAVLKIRSEEVLERGTVDILLPPDDIHRIESVGGGPSYSLHVLGADFGNHKRNVYNMETGEITVVEHGM